jgi:hypothetical protein
MKAKVLEAVLHWHKRVRMLAILTFKKQLQLTLLRSLIESILPSLSQQVES